MDALASICCTLLTLEKNFLKKSYRYRLLFFFFFPLKLYFRKLQYFTYQLRLVESGMELFYLCDFSEHFVPSVVGWTS